MPPTADGERFAEETHQLLLASNAILEGDHFVYDSGEHGSGWIDKDAVDVHPERIDRLCELLAELVRDFHAEIVCGPATGGLEIAQDTARHLGALAIFAEHTAAAPDRAGGPVRGAFELRRGFDRIAAGKRVIVVDDVINTGLAIRQTVDVVRAAGGNVVGAGALVSRGNATLADLGVTDARWLLTVPRLGAPAYSGRTS